ncbi:hypothetical protein Plhal304r1_c010g0039881 [Plasmopara halstedii]
MRQRRSTEIEPFPLRPQASGSRVKQDHQRRFNEHWDLQRLIHASMFETDLSL